jgi:hypothetical protein
MSQRFKRKKITATEYNKLMEKEIKTCEIRGMNVGEILIRLLEVAGQYDIK